MSPHYMWDSGGLGYINLVTGEIVTPFVSGVTQPFYVETVDYSGDRNVGVPKGRTLTPYSGTITNGIIQINDAGLYEDILFTGIVEVRSAAIFRRCRFVLPPTFIASNSTKSVVQILNGSAAKDILFEDCEIHNRAQRTFNGIMGRNFVMRRCVVTGCVDSWSESAGGSAPNTGYGFSVYDSCSPAVAWWYSPTINSDIHGSDTGSHSDVMQKNTTLAVDFHNTTFGAYCSEIIGTGTPGSGRDAGNTYVPPGYDYTANQATMEGWKNQFAAYTTPSQTMTGNVRRLASDGSLAGVMLNLGGLTLDHCYFGGGTVGLNAVDADIVGSTVHISDCVWWNDMLNGHGSNASTKGYAIQGNTSIVFGTFDNNRWATGVGGALLTRGTEGGFALWR